jgi:hypothetical protein
MLPNAETSMGYAKKKYPQEKLGTDVTFNIY